MKLIAPDYYTDFHCKAGECRHTCCAGWEIDIDPASMERYNRIGGEFGEKVRSCISTSPTPHFILQPEERCPLLRADNLCELIIRCGNDSLCQICTDHPRFRNYWSDRVEIGLGAACEEAARMILTADHPMKLIEVGKDEEEEETPTTEEIELLCLRDSMLLSTEYTGPAARLWEYLVYRHMADALYDGRVEQRIQFIKNACSGILVTWNGQDMEQLIELVRCFSNEVEYDDDKLDEMIG